MTAPGNTGEPQPPPSKRAWWQRLIGRKGIGAADAGSASEHGESARQFESWTSKVSWILTGSFLVFNLLLGLALGSSFANQIAIMLAADIIALAATCVGCLVGFTFGIPRALQAATTGSDSAFTRYIANTNFEQISDWLTKILVGVSLVQIGHLRPALGALGNNLRPMLGGTPAAAGFGVAICVASTVAGFLVAYMWTRVILQWFLAVTDRDIGEYDTSIVTKRMLDTTRASVAEIYDESIRAHLKDPNEAHAIIRSAKSDVAENAVTIDLSSFDPRLGAMEVPMSDDTTVRDLLNTVYAALPKSVRGGSYGQDWLLRRTTRDPMTLHDIGRRWARSMDLNTDNRPLEAAGIQRGDRLEVIPGPTRRLRDP